MLPGTLDPIAGLLPGVAGRDSCCGQEAELAGEFDAILATSTMSDPSTVSYCLNASARSRKLTTEVNTVGLCELQHKAWLTEKDLRALHQLRRQK